MHLKAIQTRIRKLEAAVDLDPGRAIEEFFRAGDGAGDFPPGRCPLTIAMLDGILHGPHSWAFWRSCGYEQQVIRSHLFPQNAVDRLFSLHVIQSEISLWCCTRH